MARCTCFAVYEASYSQTRVAPAAEERPPPGEEMKVSYYGRGWVRKVDVIALRFAAEMNVRPDIDWKHLHGKCADRLEPASSHAFSHVFTDVRSLAI